MKEFRVYVIEADEYDTNAYDIENWTNISDTDSELPTDAIEYITECEEIGSVYSLRGFQNACNLEDIHINNSFIFITNLY